MKKVIIAGTNTLLACALIQLNNGEITQKQYDEMVRRNQNVTDDHTKDVVVIGD